MYRYFLGLRYLLSRPINLLGVLGIVLGVWAQIVVVSIFSGFIGVVKEHIRSSSSDVLVWQLGQHADYAELRAAILADANVKSCAPRLTHAGLVHPQNGARPRIDVKVESDIHAPRGDNRLVTLIGIDPAAEVQVTDFVKLEPARLEPGDNWMLMSERRSLMENVGASSILTVTTAQFDAERPDIAGLALHEQNFRMGGTYATKHSGFDEFHAFVSIEVLRAALNRKPGFVSEVVVSLKDPSLRVETALRLTDALQALPRYSDRVSVIWPPKAQPWEMLHAQYLQGVDHQRWIMKIVLFVIMVVSVFQLYATLSMMVTEKRRDIGVLTAMGGTRGGVMQVFLSCGLGIAIVGTVLGVTAGCVSSIYLEEFRQLVISLTGYDLFPTHVYNLDRVPYHIDWQWNAVVAGVALTLSVVVSGLPALRAARQSPLDSLRNE